MLKQFVCLLVTSLVLVAGQSSAWAQQHAPESCSSAAQSVAIATATDTAGGVHQMPLREPNDSERRRLNFGCGVNGADAALQAARTEFLRTCRPVPVTVVNPTPQTPRPLPDLVRRGRADCQRGAVPTANGLDCACTDYIAPSSTLLNGTVVPGVTYHRMLHSREVRSVRVHSDHREVIVHAVGICVIASPDTDEETMDQGLNSVVNRSVVTDIQNAIRALNLRVDNACAHPAGPNGEISNDCADFNAWLLGKLRDHQTRLDDLQSQIDALGGRVTVIENTLIANGITPSSNVVPRIERLESIIAAFGVRLGAGLNLTYPLAGQAHVGANLLVGLDYRINRSSLAFYVDGGLGGGSTMGVGPNWALEASVGLRVMAGDTFSFSFGPVVRNHWISWDDNRFPVGNDNRLWMVGARLQANIHLDRFFLIALGLDVGYGEQTVFDANRITRPGGVILAPFVALEIPLVNPFAPTPTRTITTTSTSTTTN